MGMPHAQIPSMLAKGRIGVPTLTLLELLLTLTSPLPLLTRSLRSAVLSGTKYTLKQARGRFGLGAKMVRHAPHPGIVGSLVLQALIWAKMTSGVALEVYTARHGAKSISHCVLDIDLHLNEPKVGGRPCPPLLRLTCLCHVRYMCTSACPTMAASTQRTRTSTAASLAARSVAMSDLYLRIGTARRSPW